MTVSALIPARLNSTRLEKKLIKNLEGIPLIVRTYQNILSTKLFDEVVVITDSDEIVNILREFNVKFLKSKRNHNILKVSRMFAISYKNPLFWIGLN